MRSLAFRDVTLGSLRRANLELGPGLHVVLGRPSDGSDVLVELAAGSRRPRSGTIELDGADPAASPALRRHIGSLLARETMPPGATVKDALGLALDAPRAALDALGLGAWERRPCSQLSLAENRSIMLAVALAVPEPVLLVLFEPCAALPGVDETFVLGRLRQAAADGACVLAVTASTAEAARLGGTLWLLERRGLVPSSADLGMEVWVARTPSVRELGAHLLELPEVTAVEYDAVRSQHELRVRCQDPERAGWLILATARAAGLRVEALWRMIPVLDEVRAAHAGAVRAAYDRAYRKGMQP